MELARLGRTLIHLRPRQIAAQVKARVRGRLDDPGRLLRKLPEDGAAPPVRWTPRTDWPHPDGVPVASAEARAGRFTFLGEAHALGRPVDWSAPGASRLWRYHLQDGGFVLGLDYPLARELALEYMAQQAPARTAEGWEPYPLSLRLGHWTSAYFGNWRARTNADAEFAARLWLELRRMAAWLETHLETHLLANHLLENAVALALFGACFDGEAARQAREVGLRCLRREVSEQVLRDGAHFERSPMYQQRVLYAFASLLNTGDRELEEVVREPAARMLAWLEAMTHPDGGISLFNDAALDVYPTTARLREWLTAMDVAPVRAFESTGRAGCKVHALMESGYFSTRNAEGDALFFDAGEIGPDYQPGHAHADFLSLELSLGGRRFVVDGGNKEYEPTPARSWARSVEAHSTVRVDGAEPLELWGAFRVGRRGRPLDVVHAASPVGALRVEAAHSGYRHLPGRPTPRRELDWRAEGVLRLTDRVDAARPYACTSQLRVDGAWNAARESPECIRFERDGAVAWAVSDGELSLEQDRSYPRFGQEAPAYLLQRRLVAGEGAVRWLLGRDEALRAAGALAEPWGVAE